METLSYVSERLYSKCKVIKGCCAPVRVKGWAMIFVTKTVDANIIRCTFKEVWDYSGLKWSAHAKIYVCKVPNVFRKMIQYICDCLVFVVSIHNANLKYHSSRTDVVYKLDISIPWKFNSFLVSAGNRMWEKEKERWN